MNHAQLFRERHYQAEIIFLKVRLYCRYALRYWNIEEMMLDRGREVDHNTINPWVLHYGPELDEWTRPHLKSANDSWKVDKTYLKIRRKLKYLYRAIYSDGNTLDFLLTAWCNAHAVNLF